jgi:hypothetical protein
MTPLRQPMLHGLQRRNHAPSALSEQVTFPFNC